MHVRVEGVTISPPTFEEEPRVEQFFEYAHRDHLGSIEVVTDESGAVLDQLAYEPYGARKAKDWSSNISVSEFSSLNAVDWDHAPKVRGFTGHEHLDSTGFIHMNGRVYDPVLGRFLSPDPIVQSPHMAQSWNSHSYVQNTPTSLVDPSGYTINDNYIPEVGGGGGSGVPGPLFGVTGPYFFDRHGDEGLYGQGHRFGGNASGIPAPVRNPNESSQTGDIYVSLVVGIDSTVGGNPFPIGGPFVGGGTSVGINSAGQVFIRFSAKGEAGVWAYFGVSAFGSVGTSQNALPIGTSQQIVAIGEANIGFGPSIGGSATTDGSGLSVSRSLRTGVGYGAALSGGLKKVVYVASPPLVPYVVTGANHIAGGINSGAQALTEYSMRLSGQLVGLGNTIGGWFGSEQ